MKNEAIGLNVTKVSRARTSNKEDTGIRSARIELKTTLDTKGALEQAAILSGVTLTSFIMNVAVEKAQHVLSCNNTVTLNQQAWAILDKAIAKQTSASKSLIDLMQS